MSFVPASIIGSAARDGAAGRAEGAPLHNLERFYAGVNLGYGVARDPPHSWRPDSSRRARSFKLDPAGVRGGAQLGFNWHADMSCWVWRRHPGDRAKVLDQLHVLCFPILPSPASLSMEQKRPGSVPARHASAGRGTGAVLRHRRSGVAVTRRPRTVNNGLIFGTSCRSFRSFRDEDRMDGRAGIEGALAGNWSARSSLYIDLGSQSVAFRGPTSAPWYHTEATTFDVIAMPS